MTENKTIGLVFIEGYADWEFGFLSGSAVEIFAARIIALSPEAMPVTSIGGLKLTTERGVSAEENTDLDAVAIIGSEGWFGDTPPDIARLLLSVRARGGVIGGICAGTLPLAHADLFSATPHASNGTGWIEGKIGAYKGAEHYHDVPHAVSHGRVVTAPGTAPGTFASAFLEALYPDETAKTEDLTGMLSREYGRV
ncbi:glutamine amidotransferase [Brucella endophytica]|uniref:Glutamine amidotransferase n=1 Tax=Brucella endophytica TaxID=1963359 RepID=A0A916SG67_9HYPH|nr:DJ-1/PfpI family protein [Brucella endophytica]GGA95741.1 glutamine amidotransferase [Brucella endophytica]